MLIVSLMLPNIAVMPTMPGTSDEIPNPETLSLKPNVNIMKIGKRRLHTT
jgi:hypothetical protein